MTVIPKMPTCSGKQSSKWLVRYHKTFLSPWDSSAWCRKRQGSPWRASTSPCVSAEVFSPPQVQFGHLDSSVSLSPSVTIPALPNLFPLLTLSLSAHTHSHLSLLKEKYKILLPPALSSDTLLFPSFPRQDFWNCLYQNYVKTVLKRLTFGDPSHMKASRRKGTHILC